jgi:hypothetical protein
MALEKGVLAILKKFATAFREARERGANEADTVMCLVRFFEEVLGYDSLKGEISREIPIKDRYCDLALKIDGTVCILVEGKAAGTKELVDKHIEQAENYAARAGVRWVLLTNGIEWKLYHLTFAEHEGIAHELAFEANLLEEFESSPEGLWGKLKYVTRDAVEKEALEDYWSQKKVLSPASIVRVLFREPVLRAVRRELNRDAPVRLEIEDVFSGIREALSKEAILAAGDIRIKRRKRRKKSGKTASSAPCPSPEQSERESVTLNVESAEIDLKG